MPRAKTSPRAAKAKSRPSPPVGLPSLRVPAEVCRDLGQALDLEWLETNGLGGYASGTCVGAHTRRYHGLLIAASKPPTGRTLLLHKLQETVVTGAGSYELSTDLYHPDVVHPSGHRYLQGFALDPFPTWVYEVPGACITKTVFLPQERNAVVVRYRVQRVGDAPVRFNARLLVNGRDHHQETRANPHFRGAAEIEGATLRLTPYEGGPSLWLAHDGAFAADGLWYYNFRHPAESERGLNDREDAYSPGSFEMTAADDRTLSIVAWTQPDGFDDCADAGALAASLEAAERARRVAIGSNWTSHAEEIQHLAQAADQFLVQRAVSVAGGAAPSPATAGPATVIAGYPWFTDWGRDTLVSLPGLALVTGRFDDARRILATFVRHIDEGMVPNYFPDAGQLPEYNTVDATLWLFQAAYRHLGYTGDLAFARSIYEALVDVMRWHVRGTRFGIHVDDDGLLAWNAPGLQLTWMDARVGDRVVTPRLGKPVEVNALWFNAVRVVQRLAQEFGDDAVVRESSTLAARCHKGFDAFWNAERGHLYDVLAPAGPDPALRPNQILAASLSFPVLDRVRTAAMLAVVERELLTPFGLRSLAPSDPLYRGRYGGPPSQRDGAYHQGTVWPWLMGPFVSATVACAAGGKAAARRHAAGLLAPLLRHVHQAGLGSISEIFDGDDPHTPDGCPWQAWSVAEILRAWIEDVQGKGARQVLSS